MDTKGKKILVIEDDVKLADNVKMYLELNDYDVQTANNGQTGLDLCESFSPDLIISDVMMPELDGFSLLKRLQRIKSDVPIIIMTAKDKLRDLFEVEGVTAFLPKPFKMEELENKVREILTNE